MQHLVKDIGKKPEANLPFLEMPLSHKAWRDFWRRPPILTHSCVEMIIKSHGALAHLRISSDQQQMFHLRTRIKKTHIALQSRTSLFICLCECCLFIYLLGAKLLFIILLSPTQRNGRFCDEVISIFTFICETQKVATH
jgi:hypothetical protein